MATPALTKTRITLGALMAAGTLATGGIAGALAVTPPSDAEAADQSTEQFPVATPSQSAIPSPSKTKEADAAEHKTTAKKTTTTTTTTTKKKTTTVSKPKATKAPAPAPAPKPAPKPAPTKTKGS
jgi:outer membrane biosynthesis protein TonB